MSISGINIFLVRHYVTLIGGIARGADATSKGKVHKVGNAQTQINNLYLPVSAGFKQNVLPKCPVYCKEGKPQVAWPFNRL